MTTRVNAEQSPMLQPEGYVVLSRVANGTIDMVGTASYKTQQAALTAAQAAAASAVADTEYFIVHLDVISAFNVDYTS